MSASSGLLALGSRLGGKGDALGRYGGGADTEAAVGRGLRWLAEHQEPNGAWSPDGFQRHCRHAVLCQGRGLAEHGVGVSALATLAFLGAGVLPTAAPAVTGAAGGGPGRAPHPFSRNVQKALDYLLSRQDGRGAFGASEDSFLYSHGLALLAVSEAAALTASPVYRLAAEAGTRFSLSAQQEGGGWDYSDAPSQRSDLSITGWQVLALRAANGAGIEVPEPSMERTRRLLARLFTPDGQGVYATAGPEAERRTINMTAVGLLSALLLGSLPEESRMRRAVDRILRHPPDWRSTGYWETSFQSYYYWYAATLALFHLQGDPWAAWNTLIKRTILPLQSRSPHEDGSWPPEASWLGVSGGRVYSTATAVLTLETYYRYEPLHGRKRA